MFAIAAKKFQKMINSTNPLEALSAQCWACLSSKIKGSEGLSLIKSFDNTQRIIVFGPKSTTTQSCFPISSDFG